MQTLATLPRPGIAQRSWYARSSFVLGRYAEDHDATQRGFGLERPIEGGTVREFLAAHDRQQRKQGHNYRTDGSVPVPLPDGHVSTFIALPETVDLVSRAERISVELDCDPGFVVSYLLTGKPFMLPWIQIETRWQDLGPSFSIRVGSADVTAEEVRQAYVAALRAALGESTKPLPAHVYPLVHKEVEGRLAGLTWNARWLEWQRFAREWEITGHARNRGKGDEKTGYKTVESYRNYINKLKGQQQWIRQALETADAERAFQSTGEAG